MTTSIDDNKHLYNTLNNLFPTDEMIKNVKHFVKTKELPKDITTKQKRERFYEKYKDFSINKEEYLVFKPLKLIVIPKHETAETLKRVYKKDDSGIGKAVQTLYQFVRENYMNITRRQVQEFVKKQTNYQLTKDFAHRINKPIVGKYPNQIFCMDLIDMNSYKDTNRGYRYIMTIVDVFSRKVWLENLKMKFSFNARDALKRVIQRAGVSPSHIISDGGSEFIGEAMAKYCREQNIGQRVTRTYAPMANGIVERMNRSVRKLIRAFLAKNENRVWYNLLPNIE
jgi:transposase InsO family protein